MNILFAILLIFIGVPLVMGVTLMFNMFKYNKIQNKTEKL